AGGGAGAGVRADVPRQPVLPGDRGRTERRLADVGRDGRPQRPAGLAKPVRAGSVSAEDILVAYASGSDRRAAAHLFFRATNRRSMSASDISSAPAPVSMTRASWLGVTHTR